MREWPFIGHSRSRGGAGRQVASPCDERAEVGAFLVLTSASFAYFASMRSALSHSLVASSASALMRSTFLFHSLMPFSDAAFLKASVSAAFMSLPRLMVLPSFNRLILAPPKPFFRVGW